MKWEEWHYPPDMPEIGDYVQATGPNINDRNETFTSTGIVVYTDKLGMGWGMAIALLAVLVKLLLLHISILTAGLKPDVSR